MNRFSHAAYLPPASKPPHDPKQLPLNNKTGWRIAYSENIETNNQGSLSLKLKLESTRSLNESSGSMAGLLLPKYLVYSRNFGVLLLDRVNAKLKKMDLCTCSFVTVPYTGGVGAGPREFNDPAAIAICGDNLLVADKGNNRIAVYSLLGFLLRGFWRPPASELTQEWTPNDISISKDRKVLVADPANGCVHVFNFAGHWLRAIHGVGVVESIAVDLENTLYVVSSGVLHIKVYSLNNGEKLSEITDVNELKNNFCRTDIEVNAEGLVNLGAICALYNTGSVEAAKPAWFNSSGKLVPAPVPSISMYEQSGVIYTKAIDSSLYRCQWDRLVMLADMPEGTRVKISTFSSETELSEAQIKLLAEKNWLTRQLVFPGDKNKSNSDYLIRSEPGRFLWLRIEMTSDGVTTPEITNLQLDFPRISLARYLPAVFSEEPQSTDFTDRFLAVFDRGFRQIETTIDNMASLFDPMSTPAAAGKKDFLSWLASWIGVVLDRQLPLSTRRNLVKNVARLYQCRGTLKGLRSMLDLYLGFASRQCAVKADCRPCSTKPAYQWQPPLLVLEHFALRRWLFVGSSRLGEQAKLWGQKIVNRSQLSGPNVDGNAQFGVTQLNTRQDPLRDPFHVYAHKFSVFLPAWVGRIESYKKTIARVINAEKPAHTQHDIIYVEPKFRIGFQSMIGFDSVIGCYPQGVVLEQTRLGKASVISEQDYANRSLSIGSKSRIGLNTQFR